MTTPPPLCGRERGSAGEARLGVTTAAIAEVVRVATIGDVDAALAKLSIDSRLVPVRVRRVEPSDKDRARLRKGKPAAALAPLPPRELAALRHMASGQALAGLQ